MHMVQKLPHYQTISDFRIASTEYHAKYLSRTVRQKGVYEGGVGVNVLASGCKPGIQLVSLQVTAIKSRASARARGCIF